MLVSTLVAVLILFGESITETFVPSFDRQHQRVSRLFDEWKLVEAEKRARRLYEKYPDDVGTARLYGDILLARGELNNAIIVFQRLCDIDSARVHNHSLSLAFTHYFLGELDSAIDLTHRVKSHAYEFSDTILLTRAYHILGRIYFNKADYRQALQYQNESLKLARGISSQTNIADANRQIGVLHWYDGDSDEAHKYYTEALRIYREIGDKIGEATTISNIGHLHDKHDWQINLQHQLIAYDIRKRIGDKIGLADSYYFLAHMPRFSREMNQLSYIYFKKSLELSNEIGYDWGREVAQLAIAHYNIYTPQFPGFYIDEIFDSSGLSVEGQIQTIYGKALYYAKENDYDKATKYFLQGYTMKDSLGHNLYMPAALRNYAKSLVRIGDLSGAEEFLDLSLETARAQGTDRDEAIVSYYLADVYRRTGRLQTARNILIPLAHHSDSLFVKIIEESHPLTGFQGAVETVNEWRGNIYRLLIDILAEEGDPLLYYYIEKERSLPFRGTGFYYEYFEDEYIENLIDSYVRLLNEYDRSPQKFESIQPLLVLIGEIHQSIASHRIQVSSLLSDLPSRYNYRLRDLQSVLHPSEIFLTYFVSENSVYAFVIRNEEDYLRRINLTEDELASITDVYINALLRGYANPDDDLWRASSYRLYTLLIEPLVADSLIRKNESIIISPHKSLHLIPFHALSIREPEIDPEFLLEHYYISYAPSASLFIETRKREKQPMKNRLAVAPDIKSLPFSYTEITDIPQHLFSRSHFLTGRHARGDAVLNSFNDYDIVHISSHAHINLMFPTASYIKLSDRKLRLYELFKRDLDSRLVVLSSCGSGRQIGSADVVPNGYDLVSFPRAFLSAGVSTVIASLWIVEDETAMKIMRKFYNNLNAMPYSGNSYHFSSALINAQREYLLKNRNTAEKTHPFFWAPFILVGDTR